MTTTTADGVVLATKPPASTPQRAARLAAGPLRVQLPAPVMLEQLRWVAKTVPGRVDDLVLAGVLLEAAGSGLKLTTTTHTAVTSATVLAPGAAGAALLPAHSLVRLIAAIGNADVTLQVTDEGKRVAITGGDVRYQTPTMALADFPELPATPAALVGRLDRAAVGRLLTVGTATSVDESLPILAAVHLHVHKGHLAAAATDRYRLILSDGLAPTALPADSAWLLRHKALKAALQGMSRASEVLLRAALPDPVDPDTADTETRVHRSRLSHLDPAGWVQLVAGPRSCWLMTTDGVYPKVRPLMEQPATWEASVQRADLIEAIRQVGVLSAPGTPLQLSHLPDGRLQLLVGETDPSSLHASAAIRAIPCTTTGPGAVQPVAFNAGYLLDAARATTGQTITLRGGVSMKPVIVTGADAGHRCLLMPIRRAG